MSLRQRKLPLGRKRKDYRVEKLSPAAAQAQIEVAFRRRSVVGWSIVAALMLLWALVAAYYFLTPPVYKSKWTMILPAAQSGSSVTLETIGQTSTMPGQPFGSVALSPKVIYKEIAGSEQVRMAAARSMAVDPKKFGKARVKLIDETSLIIFQISGGTPEQAQAKAQALMRAFEDQLDVLRRDELEKRAAFVRENVKIDKANLLAIRAQMLEFQRRTGLLSINQFTETSSSAILLRRKLAELRADREKLIAEQSTLTQRMGLSPEAAAAGLRLAADPSFSQLASAYAKAMADLHEHSLRYGASHPRLAMAQMTADAVLAEISKIARAADVRPAANLGNLVLLVNTSRQSELLKAIVANESFLAGSRDNVRALEAELKTLEAKVAQMGKDAARLEALKKDHLVAEAVFTSAVARLNISRTDLFSSYPMVQVLAQPSLPDDRSQPRLLYALLAGLLGSAFILMAWGAVWVRETLGRKR